MTTLIVGASGATGKCLIEQMLERAEKVKVVVRSADSLPEGILSHSNLDVIVGNILEFSDSELAQHISGCSAVASCLGHNLNVKGMFGAPRRLVVDATSRLCSAIEKNQPESSVKFVLMNTAGNSNRDLNEPMSFAHKCVITLLRWLLPPHKDNELAADYLRAHVGQSCSAIEWVVVRPDSLVNETQTSEIAVHPSPTRSAILDPGKTSRINVACFMADLICDNDIWTRWKGKMPVIYNVEKDATRE